MIQFSNVNKNYPNSNHALVNINFALKKGEMVFLTGHSGAGKTTLLQLIMLVEKVSSGQIFVGEKNICRLPKQQIPKLRREIGVVFQNPKLLPSHSVFDNVALPLIIQGYRHQEIGRRVRAALDKVKLLHKEKLYPKALSTGEQQRIGIARAVVTRPPLLLADEPTGNLDPGLSLEIMQIFSEFNHVGATVLIATHDLPLIANMPYKILTLKQGRLLAGAQYE